jgi:hypothetical protein
VEASFLFSPPTWGRINYRTKEQVPVSEYTITIESEKKRYMNTELPINKEDLPGGLVVEGNQVEYKNAIRIYG